MGVTFQNGREISLCDTCGLWHKLAVSELMSALMKGENLTTAQLMALQRDGRPDEVCRCEDPIPSRTHPYAVNWCCYEPRWIQQSL